MERIRLIFGKLSAVLSGRRTWDADDGYPFLGNPLVRMVVAFSILIVLAAAAAAYVFIVRNGSGTIILHYNSYFGVDIVGFPEQTYFLPVMAALFLAGNVFLASRFYAGRERIAAHMLLFAALFVSASFGIAVATLSFINT
jgi:hypothetical protein